MPEGVKKVFEEKSIKLAHLEPAASEFNVTRNYLDWLTSSSLGLRSPETIISNMLLRGTVEGKILCFVGPPGVLEKTSIGKSIARALSRQFQISFSVGGSYYSPKSKVIDGTYVGAIAGQGCSSIKEGAN
ncbi:unnamed protein product [Rhizophagus irregularis]|nr:unnamed protein product [Rhizophagus irregularis]